MRPGTKSDDPRGSRAQSHASNPTSVEAYRALLTQRLRAEGAVGADASEHAELVFNLSRLHTRISQDFEVLHRRRGWTWAGFRIMNVLWVFGTVEQRDVARLSGGSRAAISSALNTLERDGLVNRTRDSHDRRLIRLELTGRGRTELCDAIREQADRERQWLSVLDASEQRLLSRLLATVADRRTP
ncbi:MarR family winged helix-turn-helix transcriptional regulator [Mycobacterium sp. M23085]|uniref:MarR family winged helix-turn-helix transcriptional regulator n=1 Tax=Mycobacterium sp. M23085 TaxID=3378087 RepID=UPI003877CE1A